MSDGCTNLLKVIIVNN